MKFSPTLQSIGALQLMLAAVLLIPLLISLLYDENDTLAILAAIGIAVLIGGPLCGLIANRAIYSSETRCLS